MATSDNSPTPMGCVHTGRSGRTCGQKCAKDGNKCYYHREKPAGEFVPCHKCGLPTRAYDPADGTTPLCTRPTCKNRIRPPRTKDERMVPVVKRAIDYILHLMATVPLEILAEGREIAPCHKCGAPTSVYETRPDIEYMDAKPYCTGPNCGRNYYSKTGRPYRFATKIAVEDARRRLTKKAIEEGWAPPEWKKIRQHGAQWDAADEIEERLLAVIASAV